MKAKSITLSKLKQKKLSRLIDAGAILSNLAYNLAQNHPDNEWRKLLRREQEKWDAARIEAVDVFRHFES